MHRKNKPGIQKEFRGLSQRTRSLLRVSEGMNVDFKREVSGIKSRDLVAFANTPLGGTILVGIDEYTDSEGVQRGRVVGCDVDDNARLVIVNKATDCFPTVELAIFVENVAKTPILRIEIPPGHYKPYCTQRGEYCIRSDARVRALFPDELLAIFMDREGEQFISRFQDAVHQLEQQVGSIRHSLSTGMLEVSGHIHDLDEQFRRTTSRIGQLTDSNKKRSRDLLQTLKESRDSLMTLEQQIMSGTANGNRIDMLEEIHANLGMLVDNLDIESNGDS
ncbi:ATP-binding protein [Pontibacterium granulatum]|uniref:AlbA family DNA-binding domain-containing protein n=1 Tax=Pontibacterium granulatum TaxID=2036029 RepID=UPI00249BF555|nr:ATP-binding protein [Pontibacterium granulatum]MDI3326835.1 ATP-binding protein [Pontibacterium granulatum]